MLLPPAPALLALCAVLPADRAAKLADRYVDAVEDLNREHARKPRVATEEELAAKLPKPAARALERLLELEVDAECAEALRRAGEAALDLDRVDDFEAVRARLAATAPDEAAVLGVALSRPRYLLRGLNGLDVAYLERFAAVLDLVLAGYDELFAFEEWSKVPGKKLRVRVHLEERITRPPHFAPQFPWHSEIDFPVVDAEAFRSPTEDGKFLFYGLCHELGHAIAMWGSPSDEEDRHAWAHYTGVAVVEHLAAREEARELLAELRDARWRALSAERERLAGTEPGTADRDAVLALFVALHDAVGPRAIGDAIDLLDAEDRRRRVNGVRYYTLRELRGALLELVDDEGARKRIEELLP